MIKLLMISYIDRKKIMLLLIFEVLVLLFITLIVYEKDGRLEMMLAPRYYQTYIKEVFMQVFMMVNAMFVLFLVMDHDQTFIKPLFAYFGRLRVSVFKYLFYSLMISFYGCYVYMSFHVIIHLLTPLDVDIDLYSLAYMYLDMLILTNLILIFMKQKFKSLSIMLIMIYIFSTLFLESISDQYQYIVPIYFLSKNYHLLELYYKICYIFLGFMFYLLKSINEQL